MTNLSTIFIGENGIVRLLLRAFGEDAVFRRAIDADGTRRYEETTIRIAPLATRRASRAVRGAGAATGCAAAVERFHALLARDGLDAAPRPDYDRLVARGVEFKIVAVEEARVCGYVACYRVECARE